MEVRADRVKVTIITLVYRSTVFADSVYESLMDCTPELHDGTADFYFVANEPTGELWSYLTSKRYPAILRDEHEPVEVIRIKGNCAGPLYLTSTYRGWNHGIAMAGTDAVCLFASDNVASEGWLTPLLDAWSPRRILCPVTVEPRKPHFPATLNGTGSIHRDCGLHPMSFSPSTFGRAIADIQKPGHFTSGGVFVPVLFSRKMARQVGLFPPGNIRHEAHRLGYPADRVLFERMRDECACTHETCWGSVVYHYQEGERRES